MPERDIPVADVCLLLEGTYPYVAGGVSTWVHQIITSQPETTFAIFHIGGTEESTAVMKYELPPNVVGLVNLHLFDTRIEGSRRKVPDSWSRFHAGLRKLLVRPLTGDARELAMIAPLLEHIAEHPEVDFEDFYHATQTWSVLREVYERYAPDESFMHFFWTARYIIEPVWKLARAMPKVPRARLYHTACTGYAGFLGALVARSRQAPLLLSEHGIYLKERIQDIWRSKWIPEFPTLRPGLTEPLGALRRLWIGFFDVLGRYCYHESAQMVSLFNRNAAVQQHFGAEASKICIVPNGISVEGCEPLYQQRLRRRRQTPGSRVVGFLGRVVPIKDVKTLLRAARRVCEVLPDTTFLIAGPLDEDAEYYQECHELTLQLHLETQVQFLGLRKRDEVLPLMDVMALTSVSEGLPFVVLEAMATGIPLVSTDVGACRELLEGQSDENPALGACGLLAETGDSDGIARALIRLLSDVELQDDMSVTGWQRARRCYHEDLALGAYRKIYQGLTAAPAPKRLPQAA